MSVALDNEDSLRTVEGAKEKGAYYTPDRVVRSLLNWAVRSDEDRLLDPSCGDGRFIAGHLKSVGIERDSNASASAMRRAPSALVHECDFFAWAGSTEERFDCAAGNPPFIRYQRFKGPVRERALNLCEALGVRFSALSSSWPLFLVATADLLRRGGRMAFVVPAEIGHAPYSAPLIEYLSENFSHLQIIAVRRKLFSNLSEDCWLLYADGHGGATEEIRFSAVDRFVSPSAPPPQAVSVPVQEWRLLWNRRLRPYLLSENVRRLYHAIVTQHDSTLFGDLAAIGIGYVSGANRFFHLRPSDAESWSIPRSFLQPTVRNGRVLPDRELTAATVERWQRRDEPMMLLRLPKNAELPSGIARYLATEQGRQARRAYKCRMRTPWYSVPDVKVPDFFLTYMSGRTPSLVRNSAAATCTNAIHAVRVHHEEDVDLIIRRWSSRFVRLSCELEGHPLGGGMLKLEPREAARIVLPSSEKMSTREAIEIDEAVSTMRAWRHYPVEGLN